jgi:hypothetical protein
MKNLILVASVDQKGKDYIKVVYKNCKMRLKREILILLRSLEGGPGGRPLRENTNRRENLILLGSLKRGGLRGLPLGRILIEENI